MVKNRTNIRKKMTMGSAVAVGTVLSLFVSAVGAFICTTMLNNETVTEEFIRLFTIGIWVIAAFIGAFAASKLTERNMLSGIIAGAAYYLLLLGIGIMFFESNLKDAMTAMLGITAGCIPVVLISMNAKSRTGRKKKYKF